jgi:hypothetical protein
MRTTKKMTSPICLEAMALEIPESPDHPNRVPFSGVLTRLDQASDQAPTGAARHRVLLPRRTAERALPSLLGMAVDYAPGLRSHDVRRKIGVITRAEIQADRLEIAGYLFGKDFPEIIREIRARRDRLGMSYEVTDVRVTDPTAKVWVLEKVTFTGAAILERSAAAYHSTSLAATAAGTNRVSTKGEIMNEKIAHTLDILAHTSQTLTAELSNLRSAVDELRRSQEEMARAMESGQAQGATGSLEARVDEVARVLQDLRHQNDALRAQAELFSAQVTRKTIAPQVLTLLAKSGIGSEAVGANGRVELPVLDKALEGLPVEQRIAVKSQLARAGALE